MSEDTNILIREILERVVRVETKIDDYNGLREKLDKAYGMACGTDKRVDKIEDNTKWLWRTLAGALIVGLIAAFVKFGG
jgi:hypothetical protein